MSDLVFSPAALINIGIGAFLGVLAGIPVAIYFQRKAAAQVDTVADALANFLEHYARSTRGEDDLGFKFTRDGSGRLTGGTTVSIKGMA